MFLTNAKLFELFKSTLDKNKFVLAVRAELDINQENTSPSEALEIEKKLLNAFFNIDTKWRKVSQSKINFESKFQSWLMGHFSLETKETIEIIDDQPSTSKAGRGRPLKSKDDCSEYTKKKKLMESNETISTGELSAVLATKYCGERQKLKGNIIKAVSKASPLRVLRIKNSIRTPPNSQPIKFSNEEALSLFLDMGLTRETYCIMRTKLREHKSDVFPAYRHLRVSKQEAVPKDCIITEESAEVKLQDLMDHTVRRIIESKTEEEINDLPKNLTLISKWGCDGSSGQSAYKQIIKTDKEETISDANMFMASVVPLRLKSETTEHWKNPSPSSTHFCRPIMFQYVKESSEVIRGTVDNIKQQISVMLPSKFQVNGHIFIINHKLFLTMIDGKVLNVLTDTKSTKTCAICKRTQKDFQDFEESITDESNFEFGMAPLHARIRCMEFILKLSYTLPNDDDDGEIPNINQRKKQIQEKLHKEIGIIVDKPKQGFGNFNDGNTSRRFFDNDNVAAHITGVDQIILKRLQVILNVLNCGENVNGEKFGEYAKDTRNLLKQKYPQKLITPTLHKVLDHGKQIIEYQPVPIGELSEEAQESKNKDYKKYRYLNTCKVSRKRQNEDLFNMLSASSDPLISSLRHARSKKELEQYYTPEMISLFDINSNNNSNIDECFTKN